MPVRVVTSHVEEQVRDTFHLPLLSCTYLHLPVATCVGCACLHEMKFKQIIQWHSLTDACPAAATTRLKVNKRWIKISKAQMGTFASMVVSFPEAKVTTFMTVR